jgi:hypothetical protein
MFTPILGLKLARQLSESLTLNEYVPATLIVGACVGVAGIGARDAIEGASGLAQLQHAPTMIAVNAEERHHTHSILHHVIQSDWQTAFCPLCSLW